MTKLLSILVLSALTIAAAATASAETIYVARRGLVVKCFGKYTNPCNDLDDIKTIPLFGMSKEADKFIGSISENKILKCDGVDGLPVNIDVSNRNALVYKVYSAGSCEEMPLAKFISEVKTNVNYIRLMSRTAGPLTKVQEESVEKRAKELEDAMAKGAE